VTKGKTKSAETSAIVDLPTAAEVQKQFAALVKAAQLLTIDVVSVHGERRHLPFAEGKLPDAAELPAPDVEMSVRYPINPTATGAAFLADIVVSWRTVSPDPEDGQEAKKPEQDKARLKVTMRVAYTFKDQAEAPSAELLNVFGREAAMHHAWPYLREKIQSLCLWLGLPPVVLPLRKK
jgi:hypothetical protein